MSLSSGGSWHQQHSLGSSLQLALAEGALAQLLCSLWTLARLGLVCGMGLFVPISAL